MTIEHGKACAICNAAKPGGNKGWHVDHCHTTGVVRGILCQRCNLMLGIAKDRPEVLLEAASYIQRIMEDSSGTGTSAPNWVRGGGS